MDLCARRRAPALASMLDLNGNLLDDRLGMVGKVIG